MALTITQEETIMLAGYGPAHYCDEDVEEGYVDPADFIDSLDPADFEGLTDDDDFEDWAEDDEPIN